MLQTFLQTGLDIIDGLNGLSLVFGLVLITTLVLLGIMAYTAKDKGYRTGFLEGYLHRNKEQIAVVKQPLKTVKDDDLIVEDEDLNVVVLSKKVPDLTIRKIPVIKSTRQTISESIRKNILLSEQRNTTSLAA